MSHKSFCFLFKLNIVQFLTGLVSDGTFGSEKSCHQQNFYKPYACSCSMGHREIVCVQLYGLLLSSVFLFQRLLEDLWVLVLHGIRIFPWMALYSTFHNATAHSKITSQWTVIYCGTSRRTTALKEGVDLLLAIEKLSCTSLLLFPFFVCVVKLLVKSDNR